MKVHIGADAESGLMHTLIGTAANVNDVTQATALLHAKDTLVFADADYQGIAKLEEAQGLAVEQRGAMRPGQTSSAGQAQLLPSWASEMFTRPTAEIDRRKSLHSRAWQDWASSTQTPKRATAMDETQCLRAEVEALKLILLAFRNQMPKHIQEGLRTDARETLRLYEERALFWPLSDQQLIRVRQVVEPMT